MKKICVIGLGYIGLPTSAMFAQSGHEVVGVDLNEKAVNMLNNGEIHIEEPGLGEIIKAQVEKGNFRASMKPEKADIFIICVPTPNKNDEYKSCDLSYVMSGVNSVLPYLKKGDILIVESTIGPRTMEDHVLPVVEHAGFNVGQDIYLAHCPERVLPGYIIREMVENNRIVGGCTPRCAEKAAEAYRSFVKGEIILTDSKTAEMSKLMENTFRDVNIALANELAKVCNSLDINCLDVINMANKHPRVNIHQPGPGVGGHCLAVDPYFIIEKAPDLAKIISLARETNCSMPHYIVSKVKQLIKDIKNPKIAACGITYKGNIDDMRESPAMEIIELLEAEKFNLSIHDPHVNTDKLHLVSFEEALEGADMMLILTDHNEFKNINLDDVIKIMRTPLVFDTKNILTVSEVAVEGLEECACSEEDGKNKVLRLMNLGNAYDGSF